MGYNEILENMNSKDYDRTDMEIINGTKFTIKFKIDTT